MNNMNNMNNKEAEKMRVNSDHLFKDIEYLEKSDMPCAKPMDIISGDSHLYGYILLPSKKYEAPHPCVLTFHGFPGYTTNNDLEYALRRMGCVVVHINHRGAWGSEGLYSFTNLIEDAKVVAAWARNEGVSDYAIDKDNIFLVGHSMGGMTVINTLRQLEWIKGAVAIAPYDLAWGFEHAQEYKLREMIGIEGRCLKQESPETIFENAHQNYKRLALLSAAEDIKDKNTLFIGAELDDIAPPMDMIEPLWNRLGQYQNSANHEYITLYTEHGLCGKRVELAESIGKWIEKLVLKKE
jgi:pimeloyl-ACP methyl ester carboxylesterase